MDVYENDFTRKDPILQDNNSRITDFAFNKDEAFYIKIRRSRNVSIDRLQLLLGPGIDTENLTLNGLIVSDLGVDNSSGGRLWSIKVDDSKYQQGIWVRCNREVA